MSVKVGLANLKFLDKKYYNQVLDKLYCCINFKNIRYQIVNNKSYLDEIKKSKHYITPHFQGFNYIFFICVIENIKFKILISKKELKFFKEQNVLHEIKMYLVDSTLNNNDFYKNTIIDGRLINVQSTNKSHFIINEVYYNSGNNIMNINLKDKLLSLNELINNLILNKDQNLEIKICKLYEFQELPDLVFNKIKMTELKINGIIFLPEYTNKYFIYTNDTEFEELKNKNVIITKQNSISASEMEFSMKKTNLPDVYELYSNDSENNVYKEGIAHIPNIKTSHFFRNVFRNKNMISVNCIKSEKYNKWIPICDEYIDYSDIIF